MLDVYKWDCILQKSLSVCAVGNIDFIESIM